MALVNDLGACACPEEPNKVSSEQKASVVGTL